jgi:hypothetical protein
MKPRCRTPKIGYPTTWAIPVLWRDYLMDGILLEEMQKKETFLQPALLITEI